MWHQWYLDRQIDLTQNPGLTRQSPVRTITKEQAAWLWPSWKLKRRSQISNLGCVVWLAFFPPISWFQALSLSRFFQGKKWSNSLLTVLRSGLVRILPATVKDPSFFLFYEPSTIRIISLGFMTQGDAKIHGYEINEATYYSSTIQPTSPTWEFHSQTQSQHSQIWIVQDFDADQFFHKLRIKLPAHEPIHPWFLSGTKQVSDLRYRKVPDLSDPINYMRLVPPRGPSRCRLD